jgi:hypothetical protein
MSKKQNALGVSLAILSFPPAALAASTTSPNAGAISLWVAAGIAYLTRRRAIGGWLFYYYLQLYGGALFTLLLSAQLIDNLKTTGWPSAALHTLFVLSVVPSLLVQALELLFATRLLFRSQRNAKNLALLRYVLVASVVAAISGLAIDSVHFSGDVPLSVFGLIVSSIWCLYFFVSRRVKHVFAVSPNTWSYEEFQAKRNVA